MTTVEGVKPRQIAAVASVPMTPAETVLQFITALEAKDLDAALALVTDDVEYDNVPMAKVDGAGWHPRRCWSRSSARARRSTG